MNVGGIIKKAGIGLIGAAGTLMAGAMTGLGSAFGQDFYRKVVAPRVHRNEQKPEKKKEKVIGFDKN